MTKVSCIIFTNHNMSPGQKLQNPRNNEEHLNDFNLKRVKNVII